MDQNEMLDQIESILGGMTTDQIKEFIKATKARAEAARRANTKKARKDEARRLILDGKLLAELVAQDKILPDLVTEARDKFLTKNADRALFGLPEIDEPNQPKRRRGRPKKDDAQDQDQNQDQNKSQDQPQSKSWWSS